MGLRHRVRLGACALLVSCVSGSIHAQDSSIDRVWFSFSPPVSDSAFELLLHTESEDIAGWSVGICHDQNIASVTSLRASSALAHVVDGGAPQFLVTEEARGEGGAGVVQAAVLSFASAVFLPRRPNGFPVLEVGYRVFGETSISTCDGLTGQGQPVETLVTVADSEVVVPPIAGGALVPALFSFDPPVSDGQITVAIHTQSANIQGWSLALCHDPRGASIESFASSEELETIRDGEPPFFHVFEEGSDAERDGLIQAVVLSAFTPLVLPPSPDGFPLFTVNYEVFEETPLEFCDDLVGSGQPVKTVITVLGESYIPSSFASGTLVPQAFRDRLAYRTEPPESGEVVNVRVFAEEVQIQGWSFALCHAAVAASVIELETAPALDRLINGEPPEFLVNDIAPADPFVAVTQSVAFGSAQAPASLGPFPEGIAALGIRYDVFAEDDLKFCDRAGGLVFDNRVLIDGVGYVPRTRVGSRLTPGALGDTFIRGDADVSGSVDMTDAVVILLRLFLAGAPLPCLDAADANDIGRVDISDPVYLLNYLFLGDAPPPQPFPRPGLDLDPDTALGCERGL